MLFYNEGSIDRLSASGVKQFITHYDCQCSWLCVGYELLRFLFCLFFCFLFFLFFLSLGFCQVGRRIACAFYLQSCFELLVISLLD